MWKPKLRVVIECFAWAEVVNCALQVLAAIYVLIKVSTMFGSPAKKADEDEREIEGVITLVAIKVLYFLLMYFIVEFAVAIYLLYAIRKSILVNMKRWMFFGTFFTIVCLTDFISTLHAMNFVEDSTVTIGIAIKLPTLILVWRYINQIEGSNGQNLVNEAV